MVQRQCLCSFLTRKRHPLLLRDTHLPWEGGGLFSSFGVDVGERRVHFRMKMINKISKILSRQADFFFLSKLMVLPKAVFSTPLSPRCNHNWISSWHLDMDLQAPMSHTHWTETFCYPHPQERNMCSFFFLLDNEDLSSIHRVIETLEPWVSPTVLYSGVLEREAWKGFLLPMCSLERQRQICSRSCRWVWVIARSRIQDIWVPVLSPASPCMCHKRAGLSLGNLSLQELLAGPGHDSPS